MESGASGTRPTSESCVSAVVTSAITSANDPDSLVRLFLAFFLHYEGQVLIFASSIRARTFWFRA